MNVSVPAGPNWWSRNWKWFVPVLVVTMLALFAGFIFAIFFFVMRMMSSSEPYQTGVSRASANPQVVAALGAPVEPGWYTMGNIEQNTASTGMANLSIPLKGPKGEATLYVEAEQSAAQWNYETLVVVIPASGQRIDLRTDTNDDNPDRL